MQGSEEVHRNGLRFLRYIGYFKFGASRRFEVCHGFNLSIFVPFDTLIWCLQQIVFYYMQHEVPEKLTTIPVVKSIIPIDGPRIRFPADVRTFDLVVCSDFFAQRNHKQPSADFNIGILRLSFVKVYPIRSDLRQERCTTLVASQPPLRCYLE